MIRDTRHRSARWRGWWCLARDEHEAAARIAAAATGKHQGSRNYQPSHGNLLGNRAGGGCCRPLAGIHFFIDDKKFDPNRIDQRVKLGAVEEWTIVNTHEHDDHVFHIHTNPFQVVSVNGKPLAVPEWRDSVIVQRKGGKVVFRSRFLDYTASTWSIAT